MHTGAGRGGGYMFFFRGRNVHQVYLAMIKAANILALLMLPSDSRVLSNDSSRLVQSSRINVLLLLEFQLPVCVCVCVTPIPVQDQTSMDASVSGRKP